jgi:uncharacterized protein YegL
MVIANPITGESDNRNAGRPFIHTVREFEEIFDQSKLSNEKEEKINNLFKNLNAKDYPPPGRKPRTYVFFVLDKSGSMESCREATISGFNEQLKTLQKEADDSHDFFASLLTFDDDVDVVIEMGDVHTIKPLNNNSYVPGGCTAMYEGVGDALDLIGKLSLNDEDAILLSVISDGLNNRIGKHTIASVAERIKSWQSRKNFTITYLGANQDLSQVSAALNIPVSNTAAFRSDNLGAIKGHQATNSSLGAYTKLRKMGAKECVSFYSGDGNSADLT